MPKLITPTEAAALYRVSLRQVLQLERSGAIPPAVRLNKRVLRFDSAQHPAQIKRPT